MSDTIPYDTLKRYKFRKDLRTLGFPFGENLTVYVNATFNDTFLSHISYNISNNFTLQITRECGNGICIEGECDSCPHDCLLGDCVGDGVCSSMVGENCANSRDCVCKQGMCNEKTGKCENLYEVFIRVENQAGALSGVAITLDNKTCVTNQHGLCNFTTILPVSVYLIKEGYVPINTTISGSEVFLLKPVKVIEPPFHAYLGYLIVGCLIVLLTLGLLFYLNKTFRKRQQKGQKGRLKQSA
jgi:hypothetical protein